MSQRETASGSSTLAPGLELTQRGWLFLLALYMLAPIAFGLIVEPEQAVWGGLLRILHVPV